MKEKNRKKLEKAEFFLWGAEHTEQGNARLVFQKVGLWISEVLNDENDDASDAESEEGEAI